MTNQRKELHILHLGAGIQSTAVALMVHRKLLPPVRAAIFADTREEHPDTYRHLDWLEREVSESFPVIRCGQPQGLGDHFLKGNPTRFVKMPYFLENEVGEQGILRRQCTSEYKIKPIEKVMRRQLLGLKPRQRIPRDTVVTHWFGISLEESARALRIRGNVENDREKAFFPLLGFGGELGWTRADCEKFLREYPVPHEVPRSACVFCPFKSDQEWMKLKAEGGAPWARAVEIDHALRTQKRIHEGMRAQGFLHRSLLPLDQVRFGERDVNRDTRAGQFRLPGFGNECSGLCGH